MIKIKKYQYATTTIIIKVAVQRSRRIYNGLRMTCHDATDNQWRGMYVANEAPDFCTSKYN